MHVEPSVDASAIRDQPLATTISCWVVLSLGGAFIDQEKIKEARAIDEANFLLQRVHQNISVSSSKMTIKCLNDPVGLP